MSVRERRTKLAITDLLFVLVFLCSFTLAVVDKDRRDDFGNLALTSVGAYWGVHNGGRRDKS